MADQAELNVLIIDGQHRCAGQHGYPPGTPPHGETHLLPQRHLPVQRGYLDLSGGIRFQSPEGVLIRNRISDTRIINFDDAGNLIGLMQNHLEYTDLGPGAQGGQPRPPAFFSLAKRETKADMIAYWYNDFGRECTAHPARRVDRLVLLDLEPSQRGPDPLMHMGGKTRRPLRSSRHPLLGYYYGDDPVVLDWQSYWLYEHGVNAVCLLGDVGRLGGSQPRKPLDVPAVPQRAQLPQPAVCHRRTGPLANPQRPIAGRPAIRPISRDHPRDVRALPQLLLGGAGTAAGIPPCPS